MKYSHLVITACIIGASLLAAAAPTTTAITTSTSTAAAAQSGSAPARSQTPDESDLEGSDHGSGDRLFNEDDQAHPNNKRTSTKSRFLANVKDKMKKGGRRVTKSAKKSLIAFGEAQVLAPGGVMRRSLDGELRDLYVRDDEEFVVQTPDSRLLYV